MKGRVDNVDQLELVPDGTLLVDNSGLPIVKTAEQEIAIYADGTDGFRWTRLTLDAVSHAAKLWPAGWFPMHTENAP